MKYVKLVYRFNSLFSLHALLRAFSHVTATCTKVFFMVLLQKKEISHRQKYSDPLLWLFKFSYRFS